MTKQQHYWNRYNQLQNGIISETEWKSFCQMYLFTTKLFIEVVTRLAKT